VRAAFNGSLGRLHNGNRTDTREYPLGYSGKRPASGPANAFL